MKHYTYTVTWDKSEEEYRGTCAEFPSLSHFDNTAEHAFIGIHDLILKVVCDMQSNGEAIPEAIADQWDYKNED